VGDLHKYPRLVLNIPTTRRWETFANHQEVEDLHEYSRYILNIPFTRRWETFTNV